MIVNEKFQGVAIQNSTDKNRYEVVAYNKKDEFRNIFALEFNDFEYRFYRYDNPTLKNNDEVDEYWMLDRVVKTKYPDSDLEEFEHYMRQEVKNMMRNFGTTWRGLDDADDIVNRIVNVEVERVTEKCADAHRERDFEGGGL